MAELGSLTDGDGVQGPTGAQVCHHARVLEWKMYLSVEKRRKKWGVTLVSTGQGMATSDVHKSYF